MKKKVVELSEIIMDSLTKVNHAIPLIKQTLGSLATNIAWLGYMSELALGFIDEYELYEQFGEFASKKIQEDIARRERLDLN